MTKILTKVLALGSIASLLIPTITLRAADMQERIHTAIQILDEKQSSSEPIPAHLINHAKGVAIFSVTKAGLGIGGQGGEGIVVLRTENPVSHSWTAPSAFNSGGASIGAQIGFTEIRYIVILNTDDAVRHFTSTEKMTWNATATGTAGAESATEKATTTELEQREIVVYKATGGVFGGATIGGTSIECKSEINQQAYGYSVHMKDILSGNVPAPKSAKRLFQLLDGKA